MTERRALLAKIHVARKDLGLDEDNYRAILTRVTGETSAGDCNDIQMIAVVKEFERLGFQPKQGTKARTAKPWVRKIYAIWKDLAPLLDDATQATLNGFVVRQTRTQKNPAGISAPEFLDPAEAKKVIHGLEGWLKRLQAKQGTAA